MRFKRSHHRKDKNHDEIVEALRGAGFSAIDTSSVGNGFPDLVVGRDGKNAMLEIKDGSAPLSQRALTEKEEMFHSSWLGRIDVVYTANEAIRKAWEVCK